MAAGPSDARGPSCEENYDDCELECAGPGSALDCAEEYEACMEAADAEDARVEGSLEVLEVIFGDDDEC